MRRSVLSQALARAFTLVELLVAMALGMILTGVIAFVFIQSGRIYSETLDEIDATYIVRSSLELIGRDLRAIQLPAMPPETGTQETGFDLTILRVDGTDGPVDELTYATLHHNADPGEPEVPIIVEVRLDPATRQLTRTITQRWDPSTGAWEAGFTAIVSNLADSVEGFAVAYSWPDQNGGNTFVRGDPAGYANSPSNGSLFVYRGSGGVADGILTVTTSPAEWDTNLPVPNQAARTIHVTDRAGTPYGSGSFPVMEVVSPTTLRLGQAVNAPAVLFMLPLHPPALKIALTHRTQRGSRRSLERVLPLKR